MKTINKIIALAAIFLALVSCSNEYSSATDTLEKGHANTYLVTRTFTEDISIDEVEDLLENSLSELGGNEYFIDYYEPDMTINLFKGFLTDRQARIKGHHFLYNTVDFKGEPKVLSGLVYYLEEARNGVMRKLDGMEVYCPSFMLKKASFKSSRIIAMFRTLYKSAVIIADEQGAGYDREDFYPICEPYLIARQTIDCQMAAMELLEELGKEFEEDYSTMILGSSHGGAVALGMQEMLENAEPASIRNKVRLERNVLLEGTPDLWTVTKRCFECTEDNLPANMENSIVPAIIAMVINAKMAHPEIMKDYEIEDFFTPEFNNQRIEIDGKEYSWVEIVKTLRLDENTVFPDKYGYLTGKDLLKADTYNEDGTLNYDNKRIAALRDATLQSSLNFNWTPQHPLYVVHCTGDDVAPYDEIVDMCNTLKADAPDHVKLITYPAKGHQNGNFVVMLTELLPKKHPGSWPFTPLSTHFH